MINLFKKLIGSRNQRLIRRLSKTVEKINAMDNEMRQLHDNAFVEKTEMLKNQAKTTDLDSLLPTAFALVREAGRRVLDMRHFDVQLLGGMILHQGNISEMKTGEGKTLVATLAAYLNALPGNGVHIVTVNDYLAERDATWMNELYGFLGMSTGVIVSGMSAKERQTAYRCDITYGTNNEFGFDFLRDNMVFSESQKVQRKLSFAIVDEVDCILIDEARTPLIISGILNDQSELYRGINQIIPQLSCQQHEDDDSGDFTIDAKSKQVYLTENGHEHIEKLLQQKNIIKKNQDLYNPANLRVLHHVSAALRAHHLYQNNVDYLIKNNQIVIVDEFTGRTMEGRRWGDGLHQAIEAKENLPIQNENQTLASITYQNYFRLYSKLSGMTGTADTEAFEFQQIYGLEVVVIPTHKTMVRDDQSDVIFLTMEEKFKAITEDIIASHERNQPVLVGTASIEVSEYLSNILKKKHIPHQVLNAKFHEKESEIIAQAGKLSAVTIATNMAGRGTDIILGGNYEFALKHKSSVPAEQKQNLHQEWQEQNQLVIATGGLRVIGTERHEARRIDNQLRGRSGRQGDPGSSQFYLSLEDNLLRIFESERIASLMQRFGIQKDEAIESKMVTRVIENAQRRVEAHNFDLRKHLLDFDDVTNDQRAVIYEKRNKILNNENFTEELHTMQVEVVTKIVDQHIHDDISYESSDIDNLKMSLERDFGVSFADLDTNIQKDKSEQVNKDHLSQEIISQLVRQVRNKEDFIGETLMHQLTKQIMLDVLDRHWQDHLLTMEQLRQGIELRRFAAKNPKQEYKKEAFVLFLDLLDMIGYETVTLLCKIKIDAKQDAEPITQQQHKKMNFTHSKPLSKLQTGEKVPTRNKLKQGRNKLCACGSGKKYKHCCQHLAPSP